MLNFEVARYSPIYRTLCYLLGTFEDIFHQCKVFPNLFHVDKLWAWPIWIHHEDEIMNFGSQNRFHLGTVFLYRIKKMVNFLYHLKFVWRYYSRVRLNVQFVRNVLSQKVLLAWTFDDLNCSSPSNEQFESPNCPFIPS